MSNGTVNRVTLIGNVGQDPVIKNANGLDIASISLATSEKNKDKETMTEWHRVVFFGKLALIVSQFVAKGSKLYVEGKLKTRKWTDKNNVERFTTEIIAEEIQLLNFKELEAAPKVETTVSFPDIPF